MIIAAVLIALAASSSLIKDHGSVDLAGTVGSSAVRMNLWRNGSKLEGYYLYESRFVTIDLSGTIHPDGRVQLTESGRSGQTKESFSGRASVGEFKGTWISRGKTKSRAFRLRPRSGPRSLPASWTRFARANCPVTFLLPSRWRPHEEENGTILDQATDGFDDGISVRWGKHSESSKPYELREDRWFLVGENGAFAASDSLRVRGLKVSRDDRPCRIQSSKGYQGMGDCACALVRGKDFWVIFETQGPRYGPALDLIVSSLRPAE